MDITTKTRILAQMWMATRTTGKPHPAWAFAHHYLDVTLPLAWAVENKKAKLTKDGHPLIEEGYAVIATALGFTLDEEFGSYWDMVEENERRNGII